VVAGTKWRILVFSLQKVFLRFKRIRLEFVRYLIVFVCYKMAIKGFNSKKI